MPYDQTIPHARTLLRWGLRIVCVSGPVGLALLVAWGFRWAPLGARPQLVVMCFMLLMLVAVGAGCIAAMAALQLATAKAFSMGYAWARLREGDQVSADEYRAEKDSAARHPLRLVENGD